MYGIFAPKNFIKVILYINAGCVLALAYARFGGQPLFKPFDIISYTVFVVTGLLWFVGETPLFPWISRHVPGMWRYFPDIDGVYDVEVESNWPIVNRKVTPDPSTPIRSLLQSKMGTVTITARLFSIRMRLTMTDRYSTSDVVLTGLSQREGDPYAVLFYVFESRVPVPEASDSESHLGACRLVVPMQREIAVLEGTYWTNRNWQKGLNTAGVIRLTKKTA